jgi:hypothetical protein
LRHGRNASLPLRRKSEGHGAKDEVDGVRGKVDEPHEFILLLGPCRAVDAVTVCLLSGTPKASGLF